MSRLLRAVRRRSGSLGRRLRRFRGSDEPLLELLLGHVRSRRMYHDPAARMTEASQTPCTRPEATEARPARQSVGWHRWPRRWPAFTPPDSSLRSMDDLGRIKYLTGSSSRHSRTSLTPASGKHNGAL